MDGKELRGLMEAYSEVYAPQEEIKEASYSAKAARVGKDIGKPGKQFAKIAKSAAERYGSEESGKKVAGAVLAKLRKEELDIFDVVLEFLQAEGYAETLEEAEWLMSNVIDEEAIDIICELTGGKGHPGYKAGSRDHGPMQSGHPADTRERQVKGGTMSQRHGYHLGDIDDDDDDEDELESIVKQQSRDSRERVRKPLRDKVKAARKVLSKEDYVNEAIYSEKGKAKAAEMIAKRSTPSGRAKSGKGANVAHIRQIRGSGRGDFDREGLGGTPMTPTMAKNPIKKQNYVGTGNKSARRAGLTPTREKPNAWKEEFEFWVDALVEEGYDLSGYTWDEMYEFYLDEAQEARNNPEKYEREQSKKYAHVRGERTPMPPRGDKRREDFEKWYAKQMGR